MLAVRKFMKTFVGPRSSPASSPDSTAAPPELSSHPGAAAEQGPPYELGLARIVLVVIATLLAGEWLIYAAGVIRSQNDLHFLEGSMVNRTLGWLRGGILYPDILDSPFACSAYGPFFYGLWALAAKIVGTDTAGGYLAGRSLALLAALGTALATYSIARRLGKSQHAALVVFPAALAFGYSWPSVTPGVFATFFEILGVWVFVRERPSLRYRLCAALCFGAAALFKQNAIGAALGLFAVDVLRGRERFRDRILAPLLFGIGVLGSYVLVDWRTAGNLHHTFTLIAKVDPKSVWLMWGRVHEFALAGAVVLSLAVVGLIRAPRETATPLAGALAGAFFIAAIGVSKGGASPNYFLTSVWIAALAAAVGFSSLRPSERAVRAGMLVALTIVAIPSRTFLSETKQRLFSRNRYARELELLARLPAGPIIAEIPEIAVRSGRAVLIDDPYAATLAFDSGFARHDKLDRALAAGKVEVVVRNRLAFPAAQSYLFRSDREASKRFQELVEHCFSVVGVTPEVEIRRYNQGCKLRNQSP